MLEEIFTLNMLKMGLVAKEQERLYTVRLKRTFLNKYDEEEDEFKDVTYTAKTHHEAETLALTAAIDGWVILSCFVP